MGFLLFLWVMFVGVVSLFILCAPAIFRAELYHWIWEEDNLNVLKIICIPIWLFGVITYAIFCIWLLVIGIQALNSFTGKH